MFHQPSPNYGSSSTPPPSPPTPYYAAFQAKVHAGDSKPLTVLLGGGNYDLVYETVTDLKKLEGQLAGQKIFVTDFNSGEKSGELTTATSILLIGHAMHLTVNRIGDFDDFYARLVFDNSNLITANFDFTTESSRGPPFSKTQREKKKIYILGDLATISLPNGYGNSTQKIQVLDLNPSQQEISNYHTAVDMWKEARRFGNRGTSDEGHEFEPVHGI